MFAASNALNSSNNWTCCVCRSLRRDPIRLSRRGISGQTAYRKPSQKLPEKPARTRFAPSPTGDLHLGSLRTALFNYLLAKATGGQFLLRIEDTDQKRTVRGAVERICRDLEWAGLQWDEGPEVGGPFGPYRQSERTSLYQQHAQQLLQSGHAYRCFCSAERLNELANHRHKLGLPTDYDRACLGIPSEESNRKASEGHAYTIRLKIPDLFPQQDDLVYGRVGGAKQFAKPVKHSKEGFEDPVLLKSDGHPTYHLANVVDDHLMNITHVVRAVEWMPSTPKHLFMYKAFGWEAPAYAHVGLLVNKNKQKLSKRHDDTGVDSFKRNGILPEALVNFVALLGWSHTLGSDKLSLVQLRENFDLKFTKGNTVVGFKKLNFLQRQYSEQYAQENGSDLDLMVQRAKEVVEGSGSIDIPLNTDLSSYIRAILRADAKSYASLPEFFQRHRSFFQFDHGQDSIIDNVPDQAELLLQAYYKLREIPQSGWTKDEISTKLHEVVIQAQEKSMEGTGDRAQEERQRIQGSLMHGLRIVVMASRPGPYMSDCLHILGKDVAMSRLGRIERVSNSMPEQTPETPQYANNANNAA